VRRLVALCLVALAGCGGGGDSGSDSDETAKERYLREFKAAIAETEREGDRVPDAPEDASLAEQAVQLREAVVLMRRLGDRLADVEPAPAIAGAHERFVRGIRAMADDATALVRAAESGDQTRVERLLSANPSQSFADVDTVRLIARARAEFESKGYAVVEPLPVPGGG
jgi:hypothetical protein